MIRIIFLSTFFICVFLQFDCEAQLIDLDKTLGNNIQLLMKETDKLKTNAINEGNYVLSQKLNIILLYLNEMKESLSKELDKSLKKVDDITYNRLNQIEKILNSSFAKVALMEEDLDLILKSSIQDICNKFSFMCKEGETTNISYIKGQIISYKDVDDYELEFKGIVFENSPITCQLEVRSIDNKVIKAVELPVSDVKKRVFLLDKLEINNLFLDTACQSLEYKLTITKLVKVGLFKNKTKNKIIYSLPGNLLLLPKTPIKFRLIESVSKFDTIIAPEYVKNTFVKSVVPNRPGPRGTNYTNLPGEISLDNNQVFIRSELKSQNPTNKYYQNRVFLQDHWDCHYIGTLSLNDAKLINGGRTFSYLLNNSLYSEPVHEVHIGEREPYFNSLYRCWGCTTVDAEILIYYGLLKEKKVDKPLKIEGVIADRISYGTYFTAKLDEKNLSYQMVIEPYYWNNNKTKFILSNEKKEFNSKYISIDIIQVSNQLEITLSNPN